MRIGIMLRHYDQHGGGVKSLYPPAPPALLELPADHEYVFLYRNPALVGTYRDHPQVREIALPAPSVLWWDQIAVPLAVRRQKIDLLFNPKYSIALSAPCPTAWVCHGLDWYVMPWASKLKDRVSHKVLVPRYAAKADAVIAVSEGNHAGTSWSTCTCRRVAYLRCIPASTTSSARRSRQPRSMPSAGSSSFPSVSSSTPVPSIRRRTSGVMIQAFAQVGPARGIPLVIAGGENRFLSEDELREPDRLGIAEWVRWPGWVNQEQLAAFYTQAEALLLPSLFESCGLPVLEAMAAGCPVVTSDCYGTKELAEGAAVLVDPESVDSIAHGMRQVLDDPLLRAQLATAGRLRSDGFTWRRCATDTLAVLERIGHSTQQSQAGARQLLSRPKLSLHGPSEDCVLVRMLRIHEFQRISKLAGGVTASASSSLST